MKSLKLLSVILAGFWVGACVTTSSTRTTQPQQEKTPQSQTESSEPQEAAEKSPSGQTSAQEAAKDQQKQASGTSPSTQEASQQTAKDKKKQASDETQSGQTDSQQAARDAQKQAVDKTASGQPAAGTEKTPGTENARESSTSAGAPATQPKAVEKGASSSRSAAAGTADSKLEEARRNLRISEATEQRIASELEQLKKSGTASPETIKNYETYHESVREMVAENRKIVEQMEAAKARYSSGATPSEATAGGKAGDLSDPRIPEEQTTGEVAALDRQLNASLNQFDAKLLKEMDEIRDGSAEKMRDLAQEAAEAAKRLREEGVDVDTSGSESSGVSKDTATQGGGTTQAEQETEGSKSASKDSAGQGGQGSSREEQGRARTEDDDIVARQLREAAENETDPELKEKLWKEYDEYKKNQR